MTTEAHVSGYWYRSQNGRYYVISRKGLRPGDPVLVIKKDGRVIPWYVKEHERQPEDDLLDGMTLYSVEYDPPPETDSVRLYCYKCGLPGKMFRDDDGHFCHQRCISSGSFFKDLLTLVRTTCKI